ncbi:hypothetical protein [Pseudomonas sp. NPDC089401]|uniref:hypothetical protein n=1 Tax=Pseudomonas sp. NPDC089401 TaxID=3364462 RepID=UPI003808EE0B
MKKIVADSPLPNTSQRAFSRCDAGHPPLFTVNPGISAHDALVHAAQYLRGAYDCGYKALEHLDETGKSLFWSNLNAVELAEGLIEALLEEIESKPVN